MRLLVDFAGPDLSGEIDSNSTIVSREISKCDLGTASILSMKSLPSSLWYSFAGALVSTK